MNHFKVGDIVIREGISHPVEGMIQGQEYVVSEEESGMWGQRLKFGTSYWYDHNQFSLKRALVPIGDPDDSPADAVNHPSHYTSDPSGVECITITRHRNFNIGNVFKYLWRLGLKESADKTTKEKTLQDIDKAIWYLQDERARIEAEA